MLELQLQYFWDFLLPRLVFAFLLFRTGMGWLLALDGRPLVEDDVEPIGFRLELLLCMVFEMVELEDVLVAGRMLLGWMAGKGEL